MTGILVDTSILIDFLRGELPPGAKSELASREASVSVITFIEACKYFHKIGQARQWDKLKDGFVKYKIIGVDTTVGELAAKISAEQGLSLADSIIYATALSRGLTLVTFDNDFRNKKNALVLQK